MPEPSSKRQRLFQGLWGLLDPKQKEEGQGTNSTRTQGAPVHGHLVDKQGMQAVSVCCAAAHTGTWGQP